MARAWPATCAGWASRSSRSTGRTARSAGAPASPIPSTPSKRPGPPLVVGRAASPSRRRRRRGHPGPRRGQALGPPGPGQGPDPNAHLGYSAPEQLRCRLKGLSVPALVAEGSKLRPTRSPDPVTAATKASLSLFAHRIEVLDDELAELDERIEALLVATVPDLLELFGVGPDTAAALVMAAGDNPERLHSEAAWAHLCGVAPVPKGSGKTSGRVKAHDGGDRQAKARCGASSWSASPMIPRPGSTSSAESRRRGQARGHPHLEALRHPRALPLPASRLNPRAVGLAFPRTAALRSWLSSDSPTLSSSPRSRKRVTK